MGDNYNCFYCFCLNRSCWDLYEAKLSEEAHKRDKMKQTNRAKKKDYISVETEQNIILAEQRKRIERECRRKNSFLVFYH